MTEPTNLERLWQRIRLQLMMLAEGSTTSTDSNISGGKPGATMLSQPRGGYDLANFDRRWAGCKTDKDRTGVLIAALACLKTYQKKPQPDLSKGAREWRIAIAEAPESSRVVASIFNVSHSTVLDYRRKHAAGKLK